MLFITREYKFQNSVAVDKIDQHTTAMRSLKKLIKPLLRIIKKKQLLKKTLAEVQQQNAYNSSLEDMRKDPVAANAINDNLANEALEQLIYDEIRHCGDNAAVIVQQGQDQHVLPVDRKQEFIPVHFARTSNGTFFWTSTDIQRQRQQELELRQHLDRWGQA
ncbi:enhancer of split malpha protein [Teleopsis dalmanni]|uniref:enhancer of split malpha protein n=1 Tax=Teleopsis dalmanni TaxID=139649 RepID=UPI0018CE4604|nr:enhancer of split malpha protein [Teleopsis dalmanni]